jgi:hypothetical protein
LIKKSKSTTFVVGEKVLLWDFAHVDKGKHSKFQKLWLGPYIIASIIGNNSYLLKDEDGWLFSYTTNGSHLKHYVESMVKIFILYLQCFLCIFDFGLYSVFLVCILIFYFLFIYLSFIYEDLVKQLDGQVTLLFIGLQNFCKFDLNDEEYKQQKINRLYFLCLQCYLLSTLNQLNYLAAI